MKRNVDDLINSSIHIQRRKKSAIRGKVAFLKINITIFIKYHHILMLILFSVEKNKLVIYSNK